MVYPTDDDGDGGNKLELQLSFPIIIHDHRSSGGQHTTLESGCEEAWPNICTEFGDKRRLSLSNDTLPHILTKTPYWGKIYASQSLFYFCWWSSVLFEQQQSIFSFPNNRCLFPPQLDTIISKLPLKRWDLFSLLLRQMIHDMIVSKSIFSAFLAKPHGAPRCLPIDVDLMRWYVLLKVIKLCGNKVFLCFASCRSVLNQTSGRRNEKTARYVTTTYSVTFTHILVCIIDERPM